MWAKVWGLTDKARDRESVEKGEGPHRVFTQLRVTPGSIQKRKGFHQGGRCSSFRYTFQSSNWRINYGTKVFIFAFECDYNTIIGRILVISSGNREHAYNTSFLDEESEDYTQSLGGPH